MTQKPKEFWKLENELNEMNQSESFMKKVALGANQKLIHVREVVPIDWDKIWKERDRFQSGPYMYNDKGLIEELVEKSLRGEL